MSKRQNGNSLKRKAVFAHDYDDVRVVKKPRLSRPATREIVCQITNIGTLTNISDPIPEKHNISWRIDNSIVHFGNNNQLYALNLDTLQDEPHYEFNIVMKYVRARDISSSLCSTFNLIRTKTSMGVYMNYTYFKYIPETEGVEEVRLNPIEGKFFTCTHSGLHYHFLNTNQVEIHSLETGELLYTLGEAGYEGKWIGGDFDKARFTGLVIGGKHDCFWSETHTARLNFETKQVEIFPAKHQVHQYKGFDLTFWNEIKAFNEDVTIHTIGSIPSTTISFLGLIQNDEYYIITANQELIRLRFSFPLNYEATNESINLHMYDKPLKQVIIKTSDKPLYCNKLILCNHSEFFRKRFSNTYQGGDIVEFPELEYKTMAAVYHFLCTGETQIDDIYECLKVFKIADELQISNLIAVITNNISNYLTSENVCEVLYQLSNFSLYNFEYLHDRVIYIICNMATSNYTRKALAGVQLWRTIVKLAN